MSGNRHCSKRSARGDRLAARRRRRLDRRQRAQAGTPDRRRRPGGATASSASTSTWPGVDQLDTFGAWLLERLTRSFTARGCDTKVTGLKDDYRALMDELHGVKLDEPAGAQRQPASPMRSPRSARHRRGRRIRSSAIVNMLGALAVALLRVADAPAQLPPHLDGAPARQCRLARGADHPADHVPDRLHHRAAGHFPFPQIRRRHLRGRHGRHAGAARTRRADRLHHGGRPLGLGLHRRTRLDEDARGDRRAAHHGLRSDRGADPAAHRWR